VDTAQPLKFTQRGRPILTRRVWWARAQRRFWSKIDIRSENECWNWMAFTNSYGYGRFGWWPVGTVINAQRAAFMLTYGRAIKPGMFICHTCDNPACCNPKHLYEGTNVNNQADTIKRNRHVFGSDEPHAKLNDDDVRAIRASHPQGRSYYSLGKQFGVSPTLVRSVVKHECWRHVE